MDRELGTWTFDVAAVTASMGALAGWCYARLAELEVDPPPLILHLELDRPLSVFTVGIIVLATA